MHFVTETPRVVEDVDPYRRDVCRLFRQRAKVHFVIKTSLDSRGRLSRQSEKMMDDNAAVTHITSGRRGRRPLPARYKSLFLATNQTKMSMSLFTIKIKKKHAVGCPSACFYIAIELNKRSGMSLQITAAQSPLGNIGSIYVQTLDQPHRKVFCFFFSKKKRKSRPQSRPCTLTRSWRGAYPCRYLCRRFRS